MKTRKQWIAMLLMLAMLFTALPLAAFAEEAPAEQPETELAESDGQENESTSPVKENMGTGEQESESQMVAKTQGAEGAQNGNSGLPKGKVIVRWKISGGKGAYNPEDEGKTVSFYIPISYYKGSDEKVIWPRYQGKVGEDDREFPVPLMIDEDRKEVESGGWELRDGNISPLRIGNSPQIYAASTGYNPKTKELEVVVYQQNNIDTKLVIKEGTEVADEDWEDLKMRLTFKKEDLENGKVSNTEDPFMSPVKAGVVVEENILFPKNGSPSVNFFTSESEYWIRDGSFYRAMEGNRMDLFNPYTGRYKKFYLKAEWTGERKAELDKRYQLEVSGNDIDGWTVTLSNREEEKPDEPSTPSVPSEIVEIVFNANEGAWANGDTRRVYRRAVDSVITIESAPMREGYKFLYWKGSKFYPGESFVVPDGGHTFVAQWEKDEKKPEEKPSVDSKIKTPRGSALTAEEISKILAGSKKVVPAIPRAGVGR